MRVIDKIIIHCSASPNGKDFDITDCDNWHKDPKRVGGPFHRKTVDIAAFNSHLVAVGYHYWIKIDGTIQSGRQVSEVGAHCQGLNSTSIGICMCGTDRFSKYQWEALSHLVGLLQNTYVGVTILGHYQTPTGANQGKKCPEFDVPLWVSKDFTPEKEHILV